MHTKLGSHHFCAATLFVPPNAGSVLAMHVQKSWLDCGKSLLHTKLGSHHVLHSQFCRTLWPLCPKTGSVLAMQPLCRSWLDVVNHTQNWGLSMCFLWQCCTHSLCPTLWPLPQNWLGPGHAAFVQVLAMQFVPLCLDVMVGLW